MPTNDDPWAWAVFSEHDDVPCDDGSTCDYTILYDPIEAQTACDDMNASHVDEGKEPGARVVSLVPFALVEQARTDLTAAQLTAQQWQAACTTRADAIAGLDRAVEGLTSQVVADNARLREELLTVIREADRLRHGVPVEGDFVCPDALEVVELRTEVERLRAEAARLTAEVARRRTADQIDGFIVRAVDAALGEVARQQAGIAEPTATEARSTGIDAVAHLYRLHEADDAGGST